MNAVEAAPGTETPPAAVIVITMGPPPAAGMLRGLMAMGADEGVLVSAREEFGGSDTYATSQILAAAISTIGVRADDIVMCGRRIIGGDTAQVGPQIAESCTCPRSPMPPTSPGRRHRHRQAHAGGRLHDIRSRPLPHHLHQGDQPSPVTPASSGILCHLQQNLWRPLTMRRLRIIPDRRHHHRPRGSPPTSSRASPACQGRRHDAGATARRPAKLAGILADKAHHLRKGTYDYV